MTTTQNAENLKAELENSGNVTKVKKITERKQKNWLKEVVFKVELTDKGYSFELLQDKYPTLELIDISYNENLVVVLKVNEVKE
jgi:hypothetical protein